MSCGLQIPLVSRWIELPGDPEPLRRELAARRSAEPPSDDIPPEPPEGEMS